MIHYCPNCQYILTKIFDSHLEYFDDTDIADYHYYCVWCQKDYNKDIIE